MKKYFIYLLLFISYLKIFSQPRLTITNGTRLNANNIVQQIVLHDNVCLENNTPSSNLLLNNTTVRFSGTGLQYIGGSQPINFHNLRITKTGSGANLDVYLNQNMQVNNQLYMESGYLDLINSIITFSSSATLQNESATRRVKATNRLNYTTPGNEGYGTGYITTTRTDPSGNVANLGLNFTPVGGNLGSTVIRRGHQRLQGTGTYTGNWSAYRYFMITPTTMRQLNINNFYYLVDGANPSAGIAELHVHPEANLQMFQRVQYWNGTTNPVYWEPRTTSPFPASDYVSSSTTSNPMMINYILITLGSTTNPLPVEFLTFGGYCKENKNIIYWQTASETNNYGFIVEKSPNTQDWSYLTFIPGNGTNNNTSDYITEDNNPFLYTTYYRLKQIDNDGQIHYSNIISVTCNQTFNNEDFYPANDAIIVHGIPGEEYQLVFTNVLGQQLLYKKFILTSPQETLHFFENLKTTGIYYVALISKRKKITKPILFQP